VICLWSSLTWSYVCNREFISPHSQLLYWWKPAHFGYSAFGFGGDHGFMCSSHQPRSIQPKFLTAPWVAFLRDSTKTTLFLFRFGHLSRRPVSEIYSSIAQTSAGASPSDYCPDNPVLLLQPWWSVLPARPANYVPLSWASSGCITGRRQFPEGLEAFSGGVMSCRLLLLRQISCSGTMEGDPSMSGYLPPESFFPMGGLRGRFKNTLVIHCLLIKFNSI